MAVITTYEKTVGRTRMTATSAAATAGADSVLLSGLGESYRHLYVTLRIFDIAGDQIIDSTGVWTIDFLGPNGDSTLAATFEDPATPTITGATPATRAIVGPVSAIQVIESTPSTEAVTFQIIVTGYKS
jgi:hypothetical protein